MIAVIVVAVLFFKAWNIGSVLLGIGILFVGTFIAYMASSEKSGNDKLKGRSSIKEYDSSWIDQWDHNCKATMGSWLQDSPSHFVDKILLAFVPLSTQTFEYFMKSLSQEQDVSKRDYLKAGKEINCSSDYATDEYLAKLLLTQIIYFHVSIFITEQTAVLKRNNFTIDSFLRQFHKPLPVSRTSMKKYERKLKNNPFTAQQENEDYYIRFLNFLELKPTEELLNLADLAFRETYNKNIKSIVNDLEKQYGESYGKQKNLMTMNNALMKKMTPL